MNMLIQALNPDNAADIAELTHLFCRVYGRRFPVKKVYDKNFWHSQVASGFISLVVKCNGELIAHVACCTDRYDQRIVHLCYPACCPEQTDRLPEIGEILVALLKRNSLRQGWTMLSYASFSETPLSQQASGMMGFSDMAILPCSYPASNLNKPVKAQRSALKDRHARSHSINSQLILRPAQEPARDLYVPPQHEEICARLYQGLGLQRDMSRPQKTTSAMLPADSRAIERNYFPASRTSYLFLQPSLVSNSERQLFSPAGGKADTVYAIVNLSDPACSDFCDRLEDGNYRFCGLLPLYKGRDNIVYFWSGAANFDVDQFESERARMLAAYISESMHTPATDYIRTDVQEIEVYARSRNN